MNKSTNNGAPYYFGVRVADRSAAAQTDDARRTAGQGASAAAPVHASDTPLNDAPHGAPQGDSARQTVSAADVPRFDMLHTGAPPDTASPAALPRIGALRLAAYTVLAAAAVAGLRFADAYLGALTVPVFLGLAVSAPIRAAADRIPLPRRAVCAALTLLSCLCALILAASFAVSLCEAASGAVGALADGVQAALRALADFAEKLSEHLVPGGGEGAERLYRAAVSAVRAAASEASARAAGAAVEAASRLPDIIAGVIAFALSAYSFAAAGGKGKLSEKFPVLAGIAPAMSAFVGAAVAEAAAVWAVCLLFLSVARVPHPFVFSLALAALDLLPVVGAASALLPWAALSFATGGAGRGTLLLLAAAASFFVKRLVESKFIGRAAGVSGILSLAAIYAGWQIAGPTGALAFTVALFCVKGIKKDGGAMFFARGTRSAPPPENKARESSQDG